MTTQPGFGKVKAGKKSRKGSAKRTDAAKQYDKMKADGMPEFNIYIRIKDKKNWFPVGSLAVNRTNKINHAIFENLEDLRQGGFRLFPILRKSQQNLEYGYRLKGSDYADEPIEVAFPPKESPVSFVKKAMDGVKKSFAGLLKRG